MGFILNGDQPSVLSMRARQKQRVLVVEDHAVARRLMEAYLELWPCEAFWAFDGEQALEMLAAMPFDVVIMDVVLPEMDGLAVTRRVRRLDGPNRTVPIIAMTANARPQDRADCLEAGMNDYLAKPVTPDELLNALNRATEPTQVDRARARRV